MKKVTYKTKGVCSRSITFEIENDIVLSVEFDSGCDGNLKAISSLVQGMKVQEVIKRLRGIDCDGRGTSCPDQLCNALENAIENALEDVLKNA